MENNLPSLQSTHQVSVFDNTQTFEHAQRMAGLLSKSTMVPTAYQGNLPNCVVALEMSNRVGMSPLMVMQNMNVIHGKPSWGSSFIIALINSCGRFLDPLQFKMSQDKQSCRAFTKRQDGTLIEGPECSIEMATAEGWMGKSGSKWKTMPELMLQYRSASFFGRLHCPDVLMGMQSQDEVQDVGYSEMPSNNSAVEKLNNTVAEKTVKPKEVVYEKFETVDEEPVQIIDEETPLVDESDDDDDF